MLIVGRKKGAILGLILGFLIAIFISLLIGAIRRGDRLLSKVRKVGNIIDDNHKEIEKKGMI